MVVRRALHTLLSSPSNPLAIVRHSGRRKHGASERAKLDLLDSRIGWCILSILESGRSNELMNE